MQIETNAERFVIEGGHPICGEIGASGNKNEALPVLAAALLTDEPLFVENLPQIGDVQTILTILEALGAEVTRVGERSVRLRATSAGETHLPPEEAQRIRGSILLAGPMLARWGEAIIPWPGGDRIGRRRTDTHLLALKALGAEIDVGENYRMRAPNGLRGADILLDEASVTATESAVMAAALAKGTTVIRNAASEPHVQGLCRLLNAMGAHIEGVGTNVLTIEGVDRLRETRHRIGSDYIEIGSLIGMAAVTGGDLLIRNAAPEHLGMIRIEFERLGIAFDIEGNDVHVPPEQRLVIQPDVHDAIPKIDDAPWPGFPADLTSVATVVATQCTGTILIFEKMFESRMFFVDRLLAMGAKIVLCDPHRAVVVGPSKLRGHELVSPDIRAGVALLIAAMCAEGTSIIHNIFQIDRGYERIDERLNALGARIERVR